MPYRPDLFTHTLNNLAVGKIARDASEKLNEIVNACRETSSKGSITLKLEIKPDKAGTGQYEIHPTIKVEKPAFPLPKTFMWGTPDGNLQAHHPDQGHLDLRSAETSNTPAKTVEESQTETKVVNN